MVDLDPVLLARIQFAANITFHIVFPSTTIALGWLLFYFKRRFAATKNAAWMDTYFFWTKIFALCFAMGVVSGITMSFQFGTNWPGFMNTIGNIAGPLLGYEILTAFFLEATFLGIMLYGFKRVSAFVHDLATFLVAAGTTFSAFWILCLDSWMQTPVGFEMINGKAHATDWAAILWNPSMPYRMVHMLLASGLTAAFLVAGISAYRWLRGDRGVAVMNALKTGVYLAAVLIPLQVLAGDQHGLNTLQYQPQKVAAMEGLWHTEKGAPFVLFGWPDKETHSNLWALEIPKVASLILTHDLNGELKGLNEFEGKSPPVAPVFWSFRLMVGLGGLMGLISWAAAYQLKRKKTLTPLVAKALVAMTFSGWVATILGWYVTEIGRQPWLVQNVLLTADAASKVPPPMIGLSLIAYLIVYGVLMTAFIKTLFHMARKGSTEATAH
ncbi:MAG: cytochrome ubiquinol oxidase subunit I [Bdellovibrionales bacterium]|jgi:cytochrome d ubiquinol oxidase subunit I